MMNKEQNEKLMANFSSIVDEAASGIRSLERVNVNGWHVNAVFISNSGKHRWESNLYFDDGSGSFTKNYSKGISGYPEASGPWILADAIISRVEAFLRE